MSSHEPIKASRAGRQKSQWERCWSIGGRRGGQWEGFVLPWLVLTCRRLFARTREKIWKSRVAPSVFPKEQPKKSKKLVWVSHSHFIQYLNSLVWLVRFFMTCLLLSLRFHPLNLSSVTPSCTTDTMNYSIQLLTFFFLPCHMACRISLPWLGIEPTPLAVKAQSPNLETAMEFFPVVSCSLFFLRLHTFCLPLPNLVHSFPFYLCSSNNCYLSTLAYMSSSLGDML